MVQEYSDLAESSTKLNKYTTTHVSNRVEILSAPDDEITKKQLTSA
jgi:hypothetical protein